MAGAHAKVKLDPAIIKLNEMQSNRYKYFRWTPRTARLAFIYVIAVPALTLWVGYKTDGMWDFRGKRKGDVIAER